MRGWRIALVADAVLNPAGRASLPDVLTILEASRYGVLQLPPASGAHGLLLAVTADRSAHFAMQSLDYGSYLSKTASQFVYSTTGNQAWAQGDYGQGVGVAVIDTSQLTAPAGSK